MTVPLAHLIPQLPHPLILAVIFLIAGFLTARLAFGDRPVWRFICQVISFVSFTALLIVADVIPFKPTPAMDEGWAYIAVSLLKVVWWLAASWLLVGFSRAVVIFDRQPSETRLLQDLIAGIIYIGAVFAIIGNVFDMPVSGLLAASGVIAIVLGLALQSTLGDVFSGIVLNIAKPYRPGDWVILDGGLQGRVVETNWRATQILTLSNDLATIPNSLVAKGKLVNASQPANAHGTTITVRLEPTATPSRSCAVLETALVSCNRILRAPTPSVTVRALDAVALECELQFFVSMIEQVPAAQNELFDLVYRHCASTGIRIAPPAAGPSLLPPRGGRHAPKDAARRLLDHLPIFTPLTDDERISLEPKLKRRIYKPGDVLIKPGAVAQALSILSSGVLIASQDRGSGEEEVLRLSPGDCFGEAGVLTDASTMFKIAALTKAVVYDIAKEDLVPILKERPAIASELGQVLARREAASRALLEQHANQAPRGENLAERLAERMRNLFGLDEDAET